MTDAIMSAANLFPAAALLITVIRILLILKVVILTQPMNQLLFMKIPLLHLLGTQEGLSQKEIAQKLGIKPPTVNVSIQRMEKGGYVYRQADLKDQRVTRIYLTDKGKEIEEKIVAMMAESEEIIIRGFSESEICLVKRMLRHMADNLDQAFRNDKDEGR